MQKIRQSHLAARKILKKSSWKNTHFGLVVDWWFDVLWTGRSSNCSAKCQFFYSSIFSYLSLLDKFFFYALNTLYRVGCRVGNSLFRIKSFFLFVFFYIKYTYSIDNFLVFMPKNESFPLLFAQSLSPSLKTSDLLKNRWVNSQPWLDVGVSGAGEWCHPVHAGGQRWEAEVHDGAGLSQQQHNRREHWWAHKQ